ncbi:hypothetical protein PR048_004872 [Dryococelus australis]|uniref:Uncharacterized protein n=1 Tax=Dryococelus australis TaxID=614101 RepID=A0ABQ9I6M1_9NEOP|nr:hypothetical protein PR048_004872 [Dryococelus australis]
MVHHSRLSRGEAKKCSYPDVIQQHLFRPVQSSIKETRTAAEDLFARVVTAAGEIKLSPGITEHLCVGTSFTDIMYLTSCMVTTSSFSVVQADMCPYWQPSTFDSGDVSGSQRNVCICVTPGEFPDRAAAFGGSAGRGQAREQFPCFGTGHIIPSQVAAPGRRGVFSACSGEL